MTGKIKWEHDTFVVDGVGISVGEYTGIDGHTLKYDSSLVRQLGQSMIGREIIMDHTSQRGGGERVGFVINVANSDGKAFVKYMLYDRSLYERVANKELGLSIEADIDAIVDPTGKYRGVAGRIDKIALVETPACPDCVTLEAKQVKLAKCNTLRLELSAESASNRADASQAGGQVSGSGQGPSNIEQPDEAQSRAVVVHEWLAGFSDVQIVHDEGAAEQEDLDMSNVEEKLEAVVSKMEQLTVALAAQHAGGNSSNQTSNNDSDKYENVVSEVTKLVRAELSSALKPIYDEQKRQEAERLQSEIDSLQAQVKKMDKHVDFDVELAGTESNPAMRIERLRGMISIAARLSKQTKPDEEVGDGEQEQPNEDNLQVSLSGKRGLKSNTIETFRKLESQVADDIASSIGLQEVES